MQTHPEKKNKKKKKGNLNHLSKTKYREKKECCYFHDYIHIVSYMH